MTGCRILSMRAMVIAVLCLRAAAFMPGQRVEGPEHFRWSEANAHALDRRYTIKSAVGLSPTQRKNLTSAVLTQLKRHKSLDTFFGGMAEEKLLDLAANTRIERVDLNGDGTAEVIAQANGLGPCGGTGNCIFWIFQMNSGNVKLLLDTFDAEAGFEVIAVRPWSTNGFRDLVLGAHISASERDLVWYRYADGTYRRWRCYRLSRQGDNQETAKAAALVQSNCEDMFTRDK